MSRPLRPQGLWVGLFIYSKMPELLDTAFLTFQKKPVIFLHWFHHVTVLLYCWHAYHHQVSSGLWFASMNYCVHSIMYFYYFIMIFPSPKPVRKAAQTIAPLITTVQILQMVGGIIVTTTGAYQSVYFPESCRVNAANYKMGLAMYGSYFALFVALFADKFLKPKKPRAATASKQAPQEFCNASVSNDAAGFFHGKLVSSSFFHGHFFPHRACSTPRCVRRCARHLLTRPAACGARRSASVPKRTTARATA